MNRPKVELVSLKKEFADGAVPAVDGIDLSIQAGETVALLGPSGCGKSTTLNMIVGLETPTSGDIQIDGQSILGVPAGKRDVGLVFQDYAVFTTMTVRKNLAFGLEVRGLDKAQIEKSVDQVAELLGMTDKLNARARDLGGSELQRVAIGRTLVTKPSVLLLDEPLSNLEAAARLAMRRELRRLQKEIGLTIIYVTHDQVEALSLADHIAVMRAGKIVQFERTQTICRKPGHIFVAGFLGTPPMNLIPGGFTVADGRIRFSQDGFSLDVTEKDAFRGSAPEGRFYLGVRPESLRVAPQSESCLSGEVCLVEPRGPEVVLTVEVGSVTLKVVAPSADHPLEFESVGLDVDPGELMFFCARTNLRRDDLFIEEARA